MMALFYVAFMVLHSQTANTMRLKNVCKINSMELLEQIRTEIEYLIHGDFHINAWTGGLYPVFPDDVKRPVDIKLRDGWNEKLTPKITVDETSVVVTYPITTKVMLKPNHGPFNIQGTMSGEVVCQLVGPDATRYTTCRSDASLRVNRADNNRLGGFKFNAINFGAYPTNSIEEISTYPENLNARRIRVIQKAASADPILLVERLAFFHHVKYEYHLLPDAHDSEYKLLSVGVAHDSTCLVLHTQEPAHCQYCTLQVKEKRITLCPTQNIRMRDGVQKWLDAFPQGKELIWQLCVVGWLGGFWVSVGPLSRWTNVSSQAVHLCSHMGLERAAKHSINWQDSGFLKHPFYDANPRSVGMVLNGEPVVKKPCSRRSQSASLTNCTEEQEELDELIDESLHVLTLKSIGNERRCQITKDLKILRTEGLEHLQHEPFFASL